MSGVELLGAVAAGAQFADLGWKIVIGLSRLCADLKHALANLPTMNQELTILVQILDKISDDLSPWINSLAVDPSGTSLTNHSPPEVGLVHELLRRAETLKFLLEKLEPRSKSKLKNAWITFVCAKKQKSIEERFLQLERLKSSLTLLNTQYTLNSTRKLEAETKEVNVGIAAMNGSVLRNIRSNESGISRLEAKVDLILASQQKHFAQSSNCTNIVPASSEHMGMNELQTTRMLFLAAGSKPAVARDLLDCLEVRDLALVHSNNEVLSALRMSGNKCAQCLKTSVGVCTHDASCQGYQAVSQKNRSSKRKGVWKISARLPYILSRVISITFEATSGAGGLSISSELRLPRIVDRSNSPAFNLTERAIRDIEYQLKGICDVLVYSTDDFDTPAELESTGPRYTVLWPGEETYETAPFESAIRKIEECLLKLVHDLTEEFFCGSASAQDQDSNGVTLLHEIARMAGLLGALSDRFESALNLAVRLLVNNGVDASAVWLWRMDGKIYYFNALAQLLDYMSVLIKFHPESYDIGKRRMQKILLDSGCELNDTAIHVSGSIFPLLSKDADIAFDCGYDELSLSIIRRSDSDMRRILRRSACVNGRPNVNYPPIAFALGWHVGTVALLDAGADPLPIIPQVIKRKDDDSLQLIFTYNFLDRFEGSREALLFSILWFALEYRATDKAVDLIADKILSGAQICQKVSRSPVNLPLLPKDHRLQYYYNSACQKGNTVYHDRSVNKIAAEKLFNVGLNVIDGVNEVGDTPLSMWCRMAFIIDQIPPREEELMLFYINKGASLVFESKIAPRSLLHAMAVSLVLRNFKLGSDFVRIAEEIAKHYPQGHCAILTDGCVCYCSTGGCIPTTLLLKSFCIEVWQQDFESSHNENVTAILDWTRLFGLTQSQKEVCFEEYSRLDVFERLGMAHTCCTYRHPGLKEKGLSCDEQVELREEDNPLNEVLTIYMQTYRRARNDYHGTSEAFWEAWTEVVNEYLPPIKTRHGRKFNIYSRAIDELESSIPVSGVSEASNQQGTFIEDAEKVYDRLKSILHLDDEAGAMYNMGQAVDHVL